MSLQRPNHHLIDLLKILAAQCIVLHHFAAYGPLSQAAAQVTPELIEWLYDYARIAVQVFLVVAGYLAARSLGQSTLQTQGLLRTLRHRFERLVLPFVAALLITVLCSAVARPLLEGDLVPNAPSLAQWLAHASLLHSVLGVDSLSAGVWYVAIDFQLYAMLALLLWPMSHHRWVSRALTAAMAVASLTWFNLDADYDVWAIYFFGAYGLGALAWWAGLRAHHSSYARALLLGTIAVGIGSLVLEFRERIALALTVSSVLVVFGGAQLRLPPRVGSVVRKLSSSSYALFLVHFSVLLLVNALWSVLGLEYDELAFAFLFVAWASSILLSYIFHVQVEQRIAQWGAGRHHGQPTPY